MKKSKKIITVTALAAVLSVAAFGAFTITAGGENNEPSVLYEETPVTVLSTETETTTTTEGTEVLEAESEIVSASVVKLSVNNAKVYSANAATAPNEIGGDDALAQEEAENAACAAEAQISIAETTTSVVVGEDLATTAVAQATAKYVVSENNDIVKSVVTCGYPNRNFGLSDKEAKSITYAAIQYLCEGTEYTGEHVEEFNALVRAAQSYNGPFKLDGVTIVVR